MVSTVIISVAASVVCTCIIIPACKSLIGFARWEIKKSKRVPKPRIRTMADRLKDNDILNGLSGIIDEMTNSAAE